MTMLMLLTLLSFQSDTVFIDRIAVKVNDKIMTERELLYNYKRRRDSVLQQYTGAELDEKLSELWDLTIEEAEELMLLYEKAVEMDVAFSEDDIRSKMESIRESNGLSDEEFEQVIKEQVGMPFDEFVALRMREDSAQNVVQAAVVSRIKIEENEISKYYDEHIEKYMVPERYRIAEIVMLKEGKTEAEIQARLDECLKFLADGGDFAEAARQYSDSVSKENGGDLGDVEFGDLNQAIEEQVRGMQVGDISKPLKGDFAVFVIKLLNRTPATPKPIQDVREEITNALRNPRVDIRINEFIKELKGQYLLKTYLTEMPWYLEQ